MGIGYILEFKLWILCMWRARASFREVAIGYFTVRWTPIYIWYNDPGYIFYSSIQFESPNMAIATRFPAIEDRILILI